MNERDEERSFLLREVIRLDRLCERKDREIEDLRSSCWSKNDEIARLMVRIENLTADNKPESTP